MLLAGAVVAFNMSLIWFNESDEPSSHHFIQLRDARHGEHRINSMLRNSSSFALLVHNEPINNSNK